MGKKNKDIKYLTQEERETMSTDQARLQNIIREQLKKKEDELFKNMGVEFKPKEQPTTEANKNLPYAVLNFDPYEEEKISNSFEDIKLSEDDEKEISEYVDSENLKEREKEPIKTEVVIDSITHKKFTRKYEVPEYDNVSQIFNTAKQTKSNIDAAGIGLIDDISKDKAKDIEYIKQLESYFSQLPYGTKVNTLPVDVIEKVLGDEMVAGIHEMTKIRPELYVRTLKDTFNYLYQHYQAEVMADDFVYQCQEGIKHYQRVPAVKTKIEKNIQGEQFQTYIHRLIRCNELYIDHLKSIEQINAVKEDLKITTEINDALKDALEFKPLISKARHCKDSYPKKISKMKSCRKNILNFIEAIDTNPKWKVSFPSTKLSDNYENRTDFFIRFLVALYLSYKYPNMEATTYTGMVESEEISEEHKKEATIAAFSFAYTLAKTFTPHRIKNDHQLRVFSSIMDIISKSTNFAFRDLTAPVMVEIYKLYFEN